MFCDIQFSENMKLKYLLFKTTFKIIRATAAAANLLFEFKIPEKKEERLTNNKNGKVILVNSTAKLNFNIIF